MSKPTICLAGNIYELVEFFDHDSQEYLTALRFLYSDPNA